MNWLQTLDQKIRKNYTLWDIGLLKTYGAIPGLIIGAYFSEWVIDNQWIFIGLFSVLLVRYLYLFTKPVH